MNTIRAADTFLDFDNNTLYVKHTRIMQLLSILQSKSFSSQWYCQHRQSIESVMTPLIHPAASSGWRSRAGLEYFQTVTQHLRDTKRQKGVQSIQANDGEGFTEDFFNGAAWGGFQNVQWTSFVTFDFFIWTGISFVNPKYSLNLENIVWGFILSSIFYLL